MLKWQNVFEKLKGNDEKDEGGPSQPSFTFEGKGIDDSYQYPNLYEEADEMLRVSLLIYSITDFRTLAKDPVKKDQLVTPEKILELPLTLKTCVKVLEDNNEIMKACLGEADHINTINSLNMIHARFQAHREMGASGLGGALEKLCNIVPLPARTASDANIELEHVEPAGPVLTHFGDENSDVDMVYAIGIDPPRKRITVAFRGSVTPTDFLKDAMIVLNRQPNPVCEIDSRQEETMGIHHGFYDYLLRPREDGTNKCQEIMGHVKALFLESNRYKDYKLYVTGHSLGGALATLFSLHAAAVAACPDGGIPKPVSCISVASPRVGDLAFRRAFVRLEEQGLLRHLRIANDGDPVTMMPSATGKKLLASLSPIAYTALKLMDKKFDERESFHHTGVKLELAKNRWDMSFFTVSMVDEDREQEEEEAAAEAAEAITAATPAVDSESSGKGIKKSLVKVPSLKGIGNILSGSVTGKKTVAKKKETNMPVPSLHFGVSYVENLCSVKTDLLDLSLNSLYQTKVSSIYEALAED